MPPTRKAPTASAPSGAPYKLAVRFDPNQENLQSINDAAYRERAERDPYTYYRLRTGQEFHGYTIKKLFKDKKEHLLQWLLNIHYKKLDEDHILRRALDKYCEKNRNAERPPPDWTPPDVDIAPGRFRDRLGQNIPIEVFDIIGLFHVSDKTLQAAGLRYSEDPRIGVRSDRRNRYWLYQVYEYARFASTPKGGTTADSALEKYLEKFETCLKGDVSWWWHCECNNCTDISGGGSTREGQRFWMDMLDEAIADEERDMIERPWAMA